MQHAQILTYGIEGRLAEVLAELGRRHSLWLRPVSQAKSCLNMLRKEGAAVLVLKLGKNLEQELALLEQVSELFPATATIVVGAAENPQLAALAWDLGARYVLFPPEPTERITEVLAGFLPHPREPPG